MTNDQIKIQKNKRKQI